jgi:streptogramin lyase
MGLFLCRKLFFAILLLSIVSSSLLSGCGASLTSDLSDPQPGSEIHGVLHGGQFPISGAHIYLMAANATTLKGASSSLLTAGSGTDSVGTYVLTQSDGTFSLSGDYKCTSGTQVYALAMGGNPGLDPATYNTAATMIALLGTCPSGDTFAGVIPFIVINEVSTVAAAYSVAAFAADYEHIGAPNTAAGATGLKNAFLTAASLVSLSSGQAYGNTPPVSGYGGALSGNGIVPQAKIYSLANSLAACINSNNAAGASSTTCSNLFSYTTYNGSTPADVFDATLNLAHSPAITTTNSNLFTLAPKNSAFSQSLATAPNDWTISIQYSSPNTSYPARPAIDLSGDVWIPNTGGTSLTELSPIGVVLSGTSGYTGGGLSGPVSVAIDTTVTNGAVWVGNYGTSNVSKFSSSGSPVSTSGYATSNGSSYSAVMNGSSPVFAGTNSVTIYASSGASHTTDSATTYNTAATVDSSGNVWAAQYESNSISKLTAAGTSSTQYTGGGLNEPTSLASDTSGDIWVANAGASRISEFGPGGTPVSSSGYTGGGLLDPYAVRIDSAGNLFVGNANGSISVFATGTAGSGTAGTPLSGSTGYTTPSTASYNKNPGGTALGIAPSYAIVGMAIDQAGNLWAPDLDGSLYEFVGLAASVAP